MINIMLCGCGGKMGHALTRLIGEDENCAVICGVDINTEKYADYPVYPSCGDFNGKADVIIDFSHPSCTDGVLEYAKSTGTPAVICTTGLSKQQRDKITEYSKDVPLFFSANMSIGINLIINLVFQAARLLQNDFDIEIIEKHHNQKIDAPSGTALAIADAVSEAVSYQTEYVYDRHSVRKKRSPHEIGIHAVRGGTIVGEHSVIFAGNDEIIELKHQAASKEVFAVGAVSAAKFLCGKANGLYSMKELVEEEF